MSPAASSLHVQSAQSTAREFCLITMKAVCRERPLLLLAVGSLFGTMIMKASGCDGQQCRVRKITSEGVPVETFTKEPAGAMTAWLGQENNRETAVLSCE